MALVLHTIHTHGGWRGGGWHANDIIAPGYRLLAALDPRPLLSDRAVPRGSCRRASQGEPGVILWQAACFIQDSLCKLEALCKPCRVLVAGFE